MKKENKRCLGRAHHTAFPDPYPALSAVRHPPHSLCGAVELLGLSGKSGFVYSRVHLCLSQNPQLLVSHQHCTRRAGDQFSVPCTFSVKAHQFGGTRQFRRTLLSIRKGFSNLSSFLRFSFVILLSFYSLLR